MKFSGPSESSGPASFVLSAPNGRKYSLIGYQGGLIRLVNLECLRIDSSFRLPLRAEEDELLTAATFNPNGVNFAIGTSLGHIFFGSVKDDS